MKRNDPFSRVYLARTSPCVCPNTPTIGDPHFLRGGHRLLLKLRQMLRTGRPPVDYADLLEPIAVVEAGQKAQRTGRRVHLRDV